ncbi:16S rRNA (guanine(966)-N(2))-methyltransferase RsmD [Desulfopila sp. IMCC35008]|uniref:16S rRNA (guanine(966)-N(2))-methyltransferase RsmD n=1 Tax=Desulfopila sp. IMCC35008 TaxID=2653858 RepID=UPI00197A9E3A|nr:16S rRNA (guanine(966)-N(2))-methyltransferase RsmD [Desulfopila sp. IMCC35008]
MATPPGKSRNIRPTADRAREALFSIISHKLGQSRVLDLFAGTGALGLEAWSRGAEYVTFVDFHLQALELLRKNIEIIIPEEDLTCISIIRHDLRKGLPLPKLTKKNNHPFNLIFLDPPYSKGLSVNVLEWLAYNKAILAEDALVIAEERSSEKLPEQFGILQLSDQRTYGDTGFWMYKSVSTTIS